MLAHNLDFDAYIATIVGSYLLGSIPTGYLVGRLKGIDVRKQGSGNIGATNAFRVLGKTAGAAVLIIDGLKGFTAACWLPILAARLFPGANPEGLALAGGFSAVFGHNYTCWLRFKGGKGIATSAGVVMAWAPWACIVALALWGLVALVTRYISVASIAAALSLPATVWLTRKNATMTGVMGALSLMAIYKHKGNVQRLIDGTENRLGAKGTNRHNPPQP